MKKYYIYTLDNDGIIFYIGKTSDTTTRLRKHKSESKFKRTHKEKYINKLIRESKEVNLSILDIVDEESVNYWETYWIEQFKQWGFNLTNATTGGEGGDYWSGRKHSKETRDKLSKIRYEQIEMGMIYPPCKGEDNGRSKLTDEMVIEMRKLREDNYSYNKLALKYGVSKTTVINIIKRRKWTHV